MKPALDALRNILLHGARVGLLSLVVLTLLVCGCDKPRAPLGDGSLSGMVHRDWEDASVSANQKVRVLRMWVPNPWQITVYPAPKGVRAPERPGWTFLKEERRQEGKGRIGSKWRPYVRVVWIYRGRVGGGPLLEAAVDKRFDRRRAERFLRNLRATGQKQPRPGQEDGQSSATQD